MVLQNYNFFAVPTSYCANTITQPCKFRLLVKTTCINMKNKKGSTFTALPFRFIYFYEPSICSLYSLIFSFSFRLVGRGIAARCVFVPGFTPASREGPV